MKRSDADEPTWLPSVAEAIARAVAMWPESGVQFATRISLNLLYGRCSTGMCTSTGGRKSGKVPVRHAVGRADSRTVLPIYVLECLAASNNTVTILIPTTSLHSRHCVTYFRLATCLLNRVHPPTTTRCSLPLITLKMCTTNAHAHVVITSVLILVASLATPSDAHGLVTMPPMRTAFSLGEDNPHGYSGGGASRVCRPATS